MKSNRFFFNFFATLLLLGLLLFFFFRAVKAQAQQIAHPATIEAINTNNLLTPELISSRLLLQDANVKSDLLLQDDIGLRDIKLLASDIDLNKLQLQRLVQNRLDLGVQKLGLVGLRQQLLGGDLLEIHSI
jgi:hypothetical protein